MAKTYPIPEGAVFRPCQECRTPITKIVTRYRDDGKPVYLPVTREGVSHFTNCTNPKRFSKGDKR